MKLGKVMSELMIAIKVQSLEMIDIKHSYELLINI